MSEYVARTKFGDIFVEVTAVSVDSAQIRLGEPDEAGALFETQICDAMGVYGAIEDASEIAISVSSRERIRDLASSLRWLADVLDRESETT